MIRIETLCDWKSTTVYGLKHKNKMIYVGKTCRSVKIRICDHFKNAFSNKGRLSETCPELYKYIRENPEHSNYTVVILGQYNPPDAAEAEIKFIKEYDTKENGCNVSSGGNSSKGSDHYLYGKKVSRHIVEASVAARIGKPLSEEHRAKQRAAHAEKKHTYKHTKTVVCDQTGETWPTIADAADYYKIPRSTLHLWIQKKRPHLGLTFSAIAKT